MRRVVPVAHLREGMPDIVPVEVGRGHEPHFDGISGINDSYFRGLRPACGLQ
jgi:hypothetical protein